MSDARTGMSLITHISWGHMEVKTNGQTLSFKDCKVWPGGAKKWDWNLTVTRHRPGIQPADIEEILTQGVEVMILSRGMQLMLYYLSRNRTDTSFT